MPWQTTRPSLLVRMKDTGDHSSWSEFDRRYGELILRYSLRRGLQLSDAEDVRQDVLLSLARTLPRFEYSPGKGRFRSYLGRVVHNAIIRHGTRPHRRREALVGEEVLEGRPEAPPPNGAWEEEWIHHHLRLAMQTVRRTFDPKSVEAFQHFLAGDSAEVVAGKTGLTRAAANKVKQRIRDRVRELVRKQVAEEEGNS